MEPCTDFASPPRAEGFQLCQITWPDGKSKSSDLNVQRSNRRYMTTVPGRAPCIPDIDDKKLILHWENLSIPVENNACYFYQWTA